MIDSMVSILMPTRRRPDNVRRSIRSVTDLAVSPQLLEVLVAVDDDDRDALPADLDVSALGRFVVKRGPRHGYQGLHHYFNELCKVARGDYFVLWNDDTEMLTRGWDQRLRLGPLYSIQQLRRDVVATSDFTFPCLGRPVYEAMGHFSMNPYNDAYVSHVALYSGTCVIRDDVVFHHHCLQDAEAATHGSAGIDRFHAPDEVEMRQLDIEFVMRAPGYQHRFFDYNVTWRSYNFKLKYEYRFGAEPLAARAATVEHK